MARAIAFEALCYNGPAKNNPNPCARADSSPRKHYGSALLIVNKRAFNRAFASPEVVTAHMSCDGMHAVVTAECAPSDTECPFEGPSV